MNPQIDLENQLDYTTSKNVLTSSRHPNNHKSNVGERKKSNIIVQGKLSK